MNRNVVCASLVLLGLGVSGCGDSTEDADWTGSAGAAGSATDGGAGQAGSAGAAGTAGGAGQAGQAGAAGAAGTAGQAGAAGEAGAAGTAGDAGTGGATKVDQDADGYDVSVDCDDTNKDVHPGQTESCNGIDDNCDGATDEGVKTTWYVDGDGDGFGVDGAGNQQACTGPAGYSNKAGDCNDADAGVNPNASEIEGNGVDENCDNQIVPCYTGVIECNGNVERHCDAQGMWTTPQDCGAQVCSYLYGCVNCMPDSAVCIGNTSHVCLWDGSGYVDHECDPLMGSSCDQGVCTGPCGAQQLGKSYIGCDYYPTVTANSLLTNLSASFAVAVSNTTTSQATVTITQGATVLATVPVDPNSVKVIPLPWTELRTATASTMVTDGAYRLRSTQPVTVYQFNPLEYTAGGQSTYTNDASLLLPVTAWNVDYVVASRNNWLMYSFNEPGFYSVVASKDDTHVTLVPSPTGGQVREGGGVPTSGAATVTLHAGDVLQVLSQGDATYDLTGTRVTSDKPVQVFGGHNCTYIPSSVAACDHIEEAMFPISSLSAEYIVSAPSLPTLTQPKAAFTRIIAIEADTHVTYDPASPGAGAATAIALAGGYIEIDNDSAFRISADKRILVAQYMKGQDAGGGSGDPAMAIAVPTPQFRNDYLFHAPTNYDTNYVNIIAHSGASVLLDGVAVTSWTPIGTSGFGVSRVALSNSGNGNHSLVSDMGAGITVYGYGQYTSYWYPGGLNLSDL
ncbi:MAG TPA: MopE-related protein [Polyangiaceae bacterium]|nr:MopE-related protein [Polyangiaceae bacterium]